MIKSYCLTSIILLFVLSQVAFGQVQTIKPEYEAFKKEYTNQQEQFGNGFFNYAGDVNGDGISDFYKKSIIHDINTSDLTDIIEVTYLYFGGLSMGLEPNVRTQTDYNNYYMKNYHPFGDLNGDGTDDVNIGFGNGPIRIQFDLSQGQRTTVEEKELDLDFQPDDITNRQYVSEIDINNDGYEDVLLFGGYKSLRDLEFEIIYGAQDIDSVKIKKQVISIPVDEESNKKYTYSFILPYDFENDGVQELLVYGFRNDLIGNKENELIVIKEGDDGGYELVNILPMNTSFTKGDETMLLGDFITGGNQEVFIQNTNNEHVFIELGIVDDEYVILQEVVGNVFTIPFTLTPIGDFDVNGVSDFIGNNGALYFGGEVFGEFLQKNIPNEIGDRMHYPWVYGVNTPTRNLGDLNNDALDDVMMYLYELNDNDEFTGVGFEFVYGNNAKELEFDYTKFEYFVGIQTPQATFSAGDFNNDGIEDLGVIFSNSITHEKNSRIELFWGESNKVNWEQPNLVLEHSNGYHPSFPAVGDFNGDGISDIAVNYESENSGIHFYWGSATPDSTTDHYLPFLSTTGVEPWSSTFKGFSNLGNIGDVNEDGIDDIGFSEEYHSSTFNWYILYGASEPTSTFDVKIEGRIAGFANLGDIDQDGHNEFLVTNDLYNQVEIFESFDGSGDGSFSETPEYELDAPNKVIGVRDIRNFGANVAVGDFNGDGKNDVAISSRNHSNGAGRVGYPPNYSYEGGEAIFIYYASNEFDEDFDHSFKIPIEDIRRLDLQSEELHVSEYAEQSRGELTTIPDLNGDGSDELLLGTLTSDYFTNALIFMGNTDSLKFGNEPNTKLEARNQTIGLGSYNIGNEMEHVHSAIGDFDNNGKLNIILPQKDSNFKESPVYFYDLGQVVVSNEEEITSPEVFELYQNYPNPFNPSTLINYSLGKDGHISINVYDIAGRLVDTLVDEGKAVGTYSVRFNGDGLASGVYFYRLTTVDFVTTKKMLLIK